jgi:hypothetical protein
MSEYEKRPFKELAEQDKIRHEEQMSTYIPPSGTASSPKKKAKAKKDPNAPKGALTNFFYFAADYRPLVKTNRPDIKGAEQAKVLGSMWKTLPEDQKERYVQLADMDKERYKRVS